MIRYRPALRDDLACIDYDDDTRREIPNLAEAQVELIDNSDASMTIYETMTGEIYAIMGLDVHGSLARGWSVFAREEIISQPPIGYTLLCMAKVLLERGHAEYGLKQVEMLQRDGVPKHQRWAEALGFEVMERLPIDGEGYLRYGRFWE